jgi:hypothetical protein
MGFERLMACAGGEEDAADRKTGIDAYLTIFVLYLVAEYWHIAIEFLKPSPVWFAGGIAVPGLLALVALAPRTRRLGFVGFTALALATHAIYFPHAGNHLLLLLLFSAMAAFFDLREDAQHKLFVQLTRWMIAIVFFYSGLQKLLHGFYFRGEVFAYYVSLHENYRVFFKFLAPPEEIARLEALTGAVGDGPYRFDAPLALLASNATYLLEMGLPPFLLWRRTRQWAVLAAAASFTLIQLAARELFFFGLFMNGLCLLLPGKLHRRFVIAFAAYFGWLLLMLLHVLPEIWFG